jgi:hypothetical protein
VLDEAAAIVEKGCVLRKRAWNAAVLIAALGVVLSLFLDRANRPDFSDFSVYWIAGGKAAHHQTVYDVQGHYQFKYSPFVALLWSAPVAHLPGTKYQWKWLHYAVSGCGWYVLWFMFARALDPRPGRAFALWILLVIVFSVGVRDELKLGQANLWPFLLVLPAWFAGARPPTRRDFDWRGLAIGVAWGLAVQWKLYALVFGPLWLLRRRPQVFVGALLVTAVTLCGIQSLAHGWSFAIAENVRWLQSLTASSEELLVSQYNVSLLGTLGKWSRHFGGSLGAWAYAIWLAVALAWGAALVWAEREAAARAVPFLVFWSAGWAWSAILLLNPLVWPYWLTLSVPLFLAYVTEATADGVRRAGPSFFIVCGVLALMNWLQNYAIVHAGGSLVAVVALLVDAYRRARTRDGAHLARLRDMPLAFPLH